MIFMHYVYEHKLLENKTGQAKNKILEKFWEKWWKAEQTLTMHDSLHTAPWWSVCANADASDGENLRKP